MKGARALAAVALVAGAHPALAFVRSTTANPKDPGKGLCLWWGKRQVPYAINATTTTTPPCQDAAAAVALIRESLPTWSAATRTGEIRACTDLSFTGGAASQQTATGNDGVNLVVFRRGLCSDTTLVPVTDACRQATGACAAKYNCWDHDTSTSVIALTTTTFDASTGEILDSDMEVHGWNGATGGGATIPDGAYLTCAPQGAAACAPPGYGQTGCNWVDLGDVAIHEAGHMLGLDHVCSYPAPYDACPAGAIMAPSFQPGAAPRRALVQDDVNGVCTIYPTGAATLTCVTAPPEPAKSGGCSTGLGGTGGLAILGVAFALWRRQRRRS